LISQGRLDDDVAALLSAEEGNVERGASNPLWLECGGRYNLGDAERLLAEVAELLTAGRLSSAVYVAQPLPRNRQSELASLTLLPRELLPGRSRDDEPPELRVVLDESISTPDDVGYFAKHGAVDAVSVDARRGLDAAAAIVERALDVSPDVTIVLSGVGQVTDLEAGLVEAAARVLPKVDLYLPGRTTVKLTRDSADDIDRGWSQPALEPVSGPPPSFPRVVSWMGRCAWRRLAPEPDPWAAAAGHNEFDVPGTETFGKNSLDSYLLEREAHRLGLRTVRFRSVDFHVEDEDGRSIGFHCTTGPSTSRYVGKVCGDKQVARALLARAGVAVPPGAAFAPEEWPRAREFALSLGWPVVVKPSNGKGGVGVTAGIRDEEALKRAFTRLGRDGHKQIIVEKHVEGADYRFLVVGDRVVSVVKRTAGGVVGDGRSSVAELVLAKNATRLRNPHLRTRLLVLGDLALEQLRGTGMTPDSVPAEGEHVILTTAGNISRGGDSVEVLDETHPSLLDLAVRAVAAVPGLDHAGVDVLAPDHRRALDGQNAAICELNSLPATTSHHYPAVGPPRNVSRALVQFYAGTHGLRTNPQPETVSVAVRISGRVQGVGYRQWFAGQAGPLELSGWVRHGERPDLVEAEVTGPLDQVSALSLQAIFGPGAARPDLVETRPVTTRHSGGFDVVK
jgi:D-alanine-D-alanine ligase-like ATP-grasp enzyme/acylphosphatase